jgi:hypothetical protein
MVNTSKGRQADIYAMSFHNILARSFLILLLFYARHELTGSMPICSCLVTRMQDKIIVRDLLMNNF